MRDVADEDGSVFQIELVVGDRTLGPSTMGAPEYIGDGAYNVSYVATKVRQNRCWAGRIVNYVNPAMLEARILLDRSVASPGLNQSTSSIPMNRNFPYGAGWGAMLCPPRDRASKVTR